VDHLRVALLFLVLRGAIVLNHVVHLRGAILQIFMVHVRGAIVHPIYFI